MMIPKSHGTYVKNKNRIDYIIIKSEIKQLNCQFEH